MAQRKGEATIEAAGTELVTSEVPSARSFRGNEDVQHSIPCRLFRNSSSAEAASRSKATSRNEELHARSARDSSLTEGKTERGQDDYLQEYLKLKREKTAAVVAKLNKDTSAAKLQAATVRQDGNLPVVGCGQTDHYYRKECSNNSSTLNSYQEWIRQASSGFLDHLANMWKQKARREVAQFRGDLDSFTYTMPEKTEQQLMALNRSQLIEYIGLLQKDSQYVGQLAVESKTKLQRMSAEVEYLTKQVQSLKQEMEVQAALYMDKRRGSTWQCDRH